MPPSAPRLSAKHVLTALRGSAERLAAGLERALAPHLKPGETMPDLTLLLELTMRLLEKRADEAQLSSLSVPIGQAAGEKESEPDELWSLVEQVFGSELPPVFTLLGTATSAAQPPVAPSPASLDALDSMKVALLRWGGEFEQARQIEEGRARRASQG